MSSLDIRRCVHAADGTSSERGGPRDRRGGSQQGSSSQSRGQPSTHPGLPGPRAFRRRRSWLCSASGARLCGARARRTCKAAWIWRCRTLLAPVARAHTTRTWKRRSRRWRARRRRRSQALDDGRTRARRSARAWAGQVQPRDRSPDAQKNDLKPWRRLMWCIGELTDEYRRRMYDAAGAVCTTAGSARARGVHRREEPATARPQPRAAADGAGRTAKDDYEYVRKGTSNLFVAVEPKAGQRVVSVTEHRGKADFVGFVATLLGGIYATARRVHLVLDNLNIHFRKCFDDVLGHRAPAQAAATRAVPLHPQARQLAEHGGDRNRHPQSPMPGSTPARQTNPAVRSRRVAARPQRRTRTIEWKFTRQDADRKLGRHYVPLFTC